MASYLMGKNDEKNDFQIFPHNEGFFKKTIWNYVLISYIVRKNFNKISEIWKVPHKVGSLRKYEYPT